MHTRQPSFQWDRAQQRELIDAAIAVNEAPTLDEAFQVLWPRPGSPSPAATA